MIFLIIYLIGILPAWIAISIGSSSSYYGVEPGDVVIGLMGSLIWPLFIPIFCVLGLARWIDSLL